jgi:hypothetical protein
MGVACGSDDGDGNPGDGSGNGGSANAAGSGNGSGNGGDGGNGASGSLPDGGVDALRDASCAGWNAEPENLPAVIQLVVDVSGSMNREAPGGNGDTKWEVTREALRVAMEDLPATTSVGVLYYPNMATDAGTTERPVSECVNVDEIVPIAQLGSAGSAQRELIDQSLDQAEANSQAGTPTHDAYSFALEALRQSDAIGTRYMLLITDGQPTFSEGCLGTGMTSQPVPEQPIVAEIEAARQEGIRTFVIGSPGSEENVSTGADARPWLSEAARAGDTAADSCNDTGPTFCHFDMTQEDDFGAALRAGLAKISGSIVSCLYDLPVAPMGQTLVEGNVNVVHTPGGGDPALIPYESPSTCNDGWTYSDDRQQVILCEAACNRVQADAQSRLELLFGCETQGDPVE